MRVKFSWKLVSWLAACMPMEGLIVASIYPSSLILIKMRLPFCTNTSIRSTDRMLTNTAENAMKKRSFLRHTSWIL